MTRWVQYYGWPYLSLRELGWKEVDMMAIRDAWGIPTLWVKMKEVETKDANSVVH